MELSCIQTFLHEKSVPETLNFLFLTCFYFIGVMLREHFACSCILPLPVYSTLEVSSANFQSLIIAFSLFSEMAKSLSHKNLFACSTVGAIVAYISAYAYVGEITTYTFKLSMSSV